jgi:uncharacterized membrane protein
MKRRFILFLLHERAWTEAMMLQKGQHFQEAEKRAPWAKEKGRGVAAAALVVNPYRITIAW